MLATTEEAQHLLAGWQSDHSLIHCWCSLGASVFQVLGWISDLGPERVSICTGDVPNPPAGFFEARIPLAGAAFDYLEGRDMQDPRLEKQIAESYVAVLLVRTADGVSFGIGLMRLSQP
jgi:hypothetical protein